MNFWGGRAKRGGGREGGGKGGLGGGAFGEGRKFEDGSGKRGVGGAGSLLSSFSFFSFFSLGVVWMGEFQSQGCLKHNLFQWRREE